MYDNIDLKLCIEEAGGVDFLHDLPERLSSLRKTTFENGNEVITGYLGLMKVKVTAQSVKIVDSSLCKWFLGDNFQGLTRGDTMRAIEKLSDLLLLPMDRAMVSRIDVAHNFIMSHECKIR